jgi:hypothetical protein
VEQFSFVFNLLRPRVKKLILAMLRSSHSDFGIFVFVFHVKTPLEVKPKTTPNLKVVKKKFTRGPFAIVAEGPSHPFFCVVFFSFISWCLCKW